MEQLRTKERNTNLELFRVVVMLAIIAHHYVVNSGLTQKMYAYPETHSALFLYLFGAWGKTGINCFVMITGYFMCKSRITFTKFLKLVLQVQFYKCIISVIFWIIGYEAFSMEGLWRILIPVLSVDANFPGCYAVFFLLIPFLNILIQNLTEKKHLLLLLMCLGFYTGLGTLGLGTVTVNYVSWFVVLYLAASYIRMYPKPIFDNCHFWGVAAVVSFGLSVVSIFLRLHLISVTKVYYFLADSHKVLAFTNGLTGFVFFKNLRLKHNKLINAMGATTYGVLLIHANSASMRKFLWRDLLNNTAFFGSAQLVVHAFISVIAIFAVCSVIDWLRIRYLERPLFQWWDQHNERFLEGYRRTETKVLKFFRIKE